MNAHECAASAVLHGQASAGLSKGPEADKEIRARIEDQIVIGNGLMPYPAPDQPYKYLGVLLTLTLNWVHQFKTSLALLKEQASQLQSSFASPAQKLQVFCSEMIAALRYVFSTLAF